MFFLSIRVLAFLAVLMDKFLHLKRKKKGTSFFHVYFRVIVKTALFTTFAKKSRSENGNVDFLGIFN